MRLTPLLLFALVLIGVATLPPGDPQLVAASRCLVCGDRGVADAILNVILFAPLGAALAYQRIRSIRMVLIGLAVSTIVELIQLYIPGRDPSAGDLLFNTIGVAGGALFPRFLRAWSTSFQKRPRLLASAWLMAAMAVSTLAGVLLLPGLPRDSYYGQWTPLFANREQYGGRVVSARVGDLRVPNSRVRRSAELRERLVRGDELRVAAFAGPAPQRGAFVFNIYDERKREVLSILADQRDLVFRYRMRATWLRLDQPAFRFRDALAGVAPEQPWDVELRLIRGGVCVKRGALSGCPQSANVARGWSVFLHMDTANWIIRAIDVVWLLILFLPAGTYLRCPAGVVAGIGVAAGGLWLSNRALGFAALAPGVFAAAAAGILVGAVIRRTLGSHPVHA